MGGWAQPEGPHHHTEHPHRSPLRGIMPRLPPSFFWRGFFRAFPGQEVCTRHCEISLNEGPGRLSGGMTAVRPFRIMASVFRVATWSGNARSQLVFFISTDTDIRFEGGKQVIFAEFLGWDWTLRLRRRRCKRQTVRQFSPTG